LGVKSGYKQTEVGVIPEDWNVDSIANATDRIFLGLTSRVDYVEHGGVPLVRATDIAGGKLCFDSTRDISTAQHKKLTQYRRARRGDVLVSKSGSLGVCAIVDTDSEFSIYESIIVVQPRRNLHSLFLLSLLRAEATQSRMIGGKVGSTVSHLNLGRFRDLEIPLPPNTSEQDAIAEALSDADAVIESLEQLIAKKRLVKQGAAQELLRPKSEWTYCRIGDVLTIAHGRSQRGVEDEYGRYPIWASGGQIGTANRWLYDKPSVLIGRKGTIDRPRFSAEPFWTVDTLFYSLIHEPNNPRYLYYQFCLINWRQYNEASGVPSLNAKTIEGIEIAIPGPGVQAAVAAVLSDMDAEIDALEAKLAKTRQMKQGMMQELLTGRIRLV
jgi:type I restriction enzyme, S subunit